MSIYHFDPNYGRVNCPKWIKSLVQKCARSVGERCENVQQRGGEKRGGGGGEEGGGGAVEEEALAEEGGGAVASDFEVF